MPSQELCFPPRLISRHEASSPTPPPDVLKSAWIQGGRLRLKSNQLNSSESQRYGEETPEDRSEEGERWWPQGFLLRPFRK